jgi:hypothetical protein
MFKYGDSRTSELTGRRDLTHHSLLITHHCDSFAAPVESRHRVITTLFSGLSRHVLIIPRFEAETDRRELT